MIIKLPTVVKFNIDQEKRKFLNHLQRIVSFHTQPIRINDKL